MRGGISAIEVKWRGVRGEISAIEVKWRGVRGEISAIEVKWKEFVAEWGKSYAPFSIDINALTDKAQNRIARSTVIKK